MRHLRTSIRGLALSTCALVVALPSGCGPGRWGAELTLSLVTTDASDVPLGPGSSIEVGSGYHVVVTRACLSLETLVVSPVAPAGDTSGDETCFCHGDPPHCHGNCGSTTAGEAPPLIQSVHRGLDLLGGKAEILTAGAAPGEYDRVTMSLSAALPEAADLPQACADLAGSAFLMEGELWAPGAQEGSPLVIDLGVTDRITEPIMAESPVEATDKGGRLVLFLRLDAALSGVDWTRVQPDGDGQITIGGQTQSNIVAVGALVTGLLAATSWSAGPESP